MQLRKNWKAIYWTVFSLIHAHDATQKELKVDTVAKAELYASLRCNSERIEREKNMPRKGYTAVTDATQKELKDHAQHQQ